ALWGDRYPALAPQVRAWNTLRAQLTEKVLAGPGAEGPEVHAQQLRDGQEECERLEAELARQVPEMNLERKLRATDWRAVARALPADTSLVEFVCFSPFDFRAAGRKIGEKILEARWELARPWQPARYLAFVVTAGAVRMIDLGEAGPIAALI